VFNVEDVVKKDASLNAFMQKCREDSRAKNKVALQQMSDDAKRQKQAQLDASAMQAKFKKGLTQFRRQLRDRLRERRDPMCGAVMRVVDDGFAHFFLEQYDASAATTAGRAHVAAPVDAALELIASPVGRASGRSYEMAREVLLPTDAVAFDDMGTPVPLLPPPSSAAAEAAAAAAASAAAAMAEAEAEAAPVRQGWSAERSGKSGARLLTMAAKSAKEQQRRRLSAEGSPVVPDSRGVAPAVAPAPAPAVIAESPPPPRRSVSIARSTKSGDGTDGDGGGGDGGGGGANEGEGDSDDDCASPSRRALMSLTMGFKSQRGLIQLGDKVKDDAADAEEAAAAAAAAPTAAAGDAADTAVGDTEHADALLAAAASNEALESVSIASDALSERAADTLHVLITNLDLGQSESAAASPTGPVMDDEVMSMSQVGGGGGGIVHVALVPVDDVAGGGGGDDAPSADHDDGGVGVGSPVKLVRARTTGSRTAARTPLNMKLMSVGTSLGPARARQSGTYVTVDEAMRLFEAAPPVAAAIPRVWAQPLRTVTGRFVHGRGAPPVGADVSPVRPAPSTQAVLQQSKSMSLSLQKSLVVSPSSTVLPPNVRPFFS
jgi:hypothetical protein